MQAVAAQVTDVQVKIPQSQRPIVTRCLGFREKAGGKLRIGTIYYEYNRATKTIRYGASIFRNDTDTAAGFNRDQHVVTAQGRFKKHPVVVENFSDNTTLKDFNYRLRQLLFQHGCRSKGTSDTDSTGSDNSNSPNQTASTSTAAKSTTTKSTTSKSTTAKSTTGPSSTSSTTK